MTTDYQDRKARRYEVTAPNVPRTKFGSPIWPTDPWASWVQLCDLARVAPDTKSSIDQLVDRLHYHGEKTKRATVERIYRGRP